MPNPKLAASPRASLGKTRNRRLRGEGKVPAVLYGKGEAPTHLLVDGQALSAAVRAKARMIDLEVEGRAHTVFLKEVQRDPIEETILHADFHRVRMDQVLRVKLPLHLKGTPAGAAEGGVLAQLFHDILVECLPADLPEHLEHAVSGLKLDEALHLKDLVLPARVKAVGDGETVLATVHKPKEEVAAEPVAEAGAEAKQPELIKKERAEDAEDGAKAEGKDKKAEPAKGEDKKK